MMAARRGIAGDWHVCYLDCDGNLLSIREGLTEEQAREIAHELNDPPTPPRVEARPHECFA